MKSSVFLFILLIPVASVAGAPGYKAAYTISQDAAGAPLRYPEAVACRDDQMIIGDGGNRRLVLYRWQNGKPVYVGQIKIPEIVNPVRMQISAAGEIFALDAASRQIVKVSADGVFSGYLQVQGQGESPMVPRSLKIGNDGSVYLLDVLGGRVVVVDTAGKLLRQVDFPKGYKFISDLAVSAKGDIFLVDSIEARLYKAAAGEESFASAGGDLHEVMSFPTSIEVDGAGNLVVADTDGGTILRFSADGTFLSRSATLGWRPGQLLYPGQICMQADGDLVVADRMNSRIQVFQPIK